jgi:hypothetical protein
MEAERTSETSVNFKVTAWRYIPKDCKLNEHRSGVSVRGIHPFSTLEPHVYISCPNSSSAVSVSVKGYGVGV